MGIERSRVDTSAAGSDELGPELRRSLAQREPAALARFFDAFFPRIHAFVQRMVRDAHAAEDLTQEVLMRIHRSLASYEPERALRPWVFTIAANVVRDHLRSRTFHARTTGVSLEDADLDDEPVDATPPSRELEHAESAGAVADEIEALPTGVRRVFLLRHFEGLAFADIARILELTEPAARQRFSRAVRILRERLAPGIQDAESTR